MGAVTAFLSDVRGRLGGVHCSWVEGQVQALEAGELVGRFDDGDGLDGRIGEPEEQKK